MRPAFRDRGEHDRRLEKICVIGPGIVGMPMAALLARAIARGTLDAYREVVVVQRASATSGWKVDAINAGRSPIGGIEPELDAVIAETVATGTLRATHDYAELVDGQVVLVCTQSDRNGLGPDYGPLFSAIGELAAALRRRAAGRTPLVIIESTLAPSSMQTVVRERFAEHGLVDGRDLLLGNSPNRVMPGRLVERIESSDKLVAGLAPAVPRLIAQLYGTIVTRGTLRQTNSLTAELVKTLENAYRDVRIAYSTEVARHCDARDVDFGAVRREVNERLEQTDGASADPNAVPSGGLLIPTIGVGGHCLPKDGILLCWPRLRQGTSVRNSLFLESRRINDESPAQTARLAERHFGSLAGRRIALLGTAYRFNSSDTRNSPTISLALRLRELQCEVTLHDPYVDATDHNLVRFGLADRFTRDLGQAVAEADVVFLCTAHRLYLEEWPWIRRAARRAVGVVDGCNLLDHGSTDAGIRYVGIGRGRRPPQRALLDAVLRGFRAVERGVANELADLVEFLNEHYALDPFNRVEFHDVQRLAATCATGCVIVDPLRETRFDARPPFRSRLVARALSTPAAFPPPDHVSARRRSPGDDRQETIARM